MPALCEQLLLDPVPGAAWTELSPRRVLPRQRCPEPGHRLVELVQIQPCRPRDRLVPHPPAGLTVVRARDHDPVQHAGKRGPLHVEAEAPPSQRRAQDVRAAGRIPQCTEQHRRADGAPAHLRVPGAAVRFRQRHKRPGEEAGGLDQPVKPAGGREPVEAAEGGDHALACPTLDAAALDDLQIGPALDGLCSSEHVPLRLCVGIT